MSRVNVPLFIILLFFQACFEVESSTGGSDPQLLIYGKIQYAGNMGLISIGAGRFFINNRLSVDFNYGYLPKWVNGVLVHTLALKPAFHFLNKKNNKFETGFYTGISTNYSITNNTYIKFPDIYPKGYYLTNAIHFCPFLGVKLSIMGSKRKALSLTMYSEIGTVDYMVYYALSKEAIRLHEIWNLCYGFTISFRK